MEDAVEFAPLDLYGSEILPPEAPKMLKAIRRFGNGRSIVTSEVKVRAPTSFNYVHV